MALPETSSGIPADVEAQRKTKCPDNVLLAIYGTVEDKRKAYDHSLVRWWTEYSDRKNDEEDEHVADSLLYDRNHLPRSAPPPECFHEARSQQGKVLQTSETVNPVVTTAQSSTVVTAESSTLSRPLPE